MNELSSEIHVLLTSTARNAVLTTDEYIDPTDGLIHCKSCGGQRQAVVPIPGSAECFTPRCLCPCQTLTEQHRRAAEETYRAHLAQPRARLTRPSFMRLHFR